MKEIRMVDLQGQYLKIKEEINSSIQRVINSAAFIKGPDVSDFQDELAQYLGSSHCIACGNGTDALQIAMMALDLHPGDEVITTPFTFIATIEVISLLKLKPVLVDIEPDTFNLNADLLEKAISNKTKAIVPVHLFGQAANMDKILNIANKHGIHVIEDNAQAIGANYTFKDGTQKKTGTIGTIGCTSFFPSKNLGAFGDGGALFTDNNELASKIKSIVNHGMSKRYFYEHVGVNSRLDTIQAAILKVKLKYLNSFNAARQAVAEAYDNAFSSVPELRIPFRNPDSDHVFHQYTLQTDEKLRNELKQHLSEHQIPAMIYYPVPLHLQTAYKSLGYKKGDFPVAEEMCEKVLSLPIHTEMEDAQLNHIITQVQHFFK